MRKILLAAAALVALVAPASANDIFCAMVDIHGNSLAYEFAFNSQNASGVFGGTLAETGFMKNGRTVTSEIGMRPIWYVGKNQINGLLITQRSDPAWRIGLENGNLNFGANALLYHKQFTVGQGR